MSERKRCEVLYAGARHHLRWDLELPAEATVEQALALARRSAPCEGAAAQTVGQAEEVPWDSAAVGIFGELVPRTQVPRDGDRIEIYRPLLHDPKEARRQRARRR